MVCCSIGGSIRKLNGTQIMGQYCVAKCHLSLRTSHGSWFGGSETMIRSHVYANSSPLWQQTAWQWLRQGPHLSKLIALCLLHPTFTHLLDPSSLLSQLFSIQSWRCSRHILCVRSDPRHLPGPRGCSLTMPCLMPRGFPADKAGDAQTLSVPVPVQSGCMRSSCSMGPIFTKEKSSRT